MTAAQILAVILAGYAVTFALFVLMMALAEVTERVVEWWRRGK